MDLIYVKLNGLSICKTKWTKYNIERKRDHVLKDNKNKKGTWEKLEGGKESGDEYSFWKYNEIKWKKNVLSN